MKRNVPIALAALVFGLCVGNLPAQDESVKEAQKKLLEAQRQLQQAIEAQAKEAVRHAKERVKPPAEGTPAVQVNKGTIVVTGPDGKLMVREFNPLGELVAHAEWNEFIIGVTLREVPEGFHGLMGLEDAVGVLVSDVLPDSPAQHSGIQRHDLIISINGEAVRSPEQIQKLIGKAGEQEQHLQIRRKQDTLEVKVTPRKNDQPQPEVPSLNFTGGGKPFADGEAPLHFRMLGPAMVTPPPVAELESVKKELKSLHQKLQEQQAQMDKLIQSIQQLKSDK